MTIKDYPNHFIVGNIVYRGEKAKRIIKPNEHGVYNIKYKGCNYLHTLEDLLRGPSEAIKPIEEEEKAEVVCPSLIIDLHLKGLPVIAMAKELNADISYVKEIKSRFDKGQQFHTICKNFGFNIMDVKRKYNLYRDLVEENLDAEDRLRIVSRHLKDKE